MHLVKAVPIVIPRIFPPTVADRLVAIAPLRQPSVDIVFVGVNLRARGDELGDQRGNGLLLDVFQHPYHHPPAALDHAEDGWFFFL
jgi:hypothetical protein